MIPLDLTPMSWPVVVLYAVIAVCSVWMIWLVVKKY